MSNILDSVLGIHATAVTMRAKRSSLLAENIANADTPNYKAKDVDFKSLLANQENKTGVNLIRSHKSHINPLSAGFNSTDVKYRNPLQASLDGNTVDTEVEHSQFAQNAIQYQASLHFLNSKVKGMIRALKGE